MSERTVPVLRGCEIRRVHTTVRTIMMCDAFHITRNNSFVEDGVRCGWGVTPTPHPLLVQRSKIE